MTPTVSTIIPIYNSAKYLAECLTSVLSQTSAVAEVIVVDDGSSDSGGELARSFGNRVRYVAQEHQGVGAARNRGVSESCGDYITFIDADDLWTNEKTQRQLETLQKHDADLTFGEVEQFYSADLRPEQYPAAPGLLRSTGYLAGAMMLPRSALERVGPFRTDLVLGSFIDWYCRARAAELKESVTASTVLRRRIHADNATRHLQAERKDYLHVLREKIGRERSVGKGV